MTVVDLLRGRLKGFRGEAHRAAVALGLKASPADGQSAAA
jgi:gp16 family phage-associated protein